MKTILVCLIAFAAIGCTDAQKAAFGALGEEAVITCYSGGAAVFTDESTGKIQSDNSGLMFRSKNTGKYIRAYADCIVVSK